MGQVSTKLRNRFGKLGRRVKQQMAKEVAPLGPPMGVKDVPTLVKEGHDPIHSVYVHVQNITSVFAENVSPLPECRQYYKIVEKAEVVDNAPQDVSPQRSVSLWQRTEVSGLLLRQRRGKLKRRRRSWAAVASSCCCC